MMAQAYEAFIIEVGLYGDIFTYDFDRYGVLATDGTWFKKFWELADHLKVTVALDSQFHVQPERQGDTAIMDLLMRSQKMLP